MVAEARDGHRVRVLAAVATFVASQTHQAQSVAIYALPTCLSLTLTIAASFCSSSSCQNPNGPRARPPATVTSPRARDHSSRIETTDPYQHDMAVLPSARASCPMPLAYTMLAARGVRVSTAAHPAPPQLNHLPASPRASSSAKFQSLKRPPALATLIAGHAENRQVLSRLPQSVASKVLATAH